MVTDPEHQAAPQLPDERLGEIISKAFDDFWTEDCSGYERDAWTAAAKAARAELFASAPRTRCPHVMFAAEHQDMRVDYTGLLKQARNGLRREPALAELLRQLQDHMEELGRRWYSGDTVAVDEFLQLYCVAREERLTAKAVCSSSAVD